MSLRQLQNNKALKRERGVGARLCGFKTVTKQQGSQTSN